MASGFMEPPCTSGAAQAGRRAPDDGAGDVQVRCTGRPAVEDEGPQRRQVGVVVVAPSLEPVDVGLLDAQRRVLRVRHDRGRSRRRRRTGRSAPWSAPRPRRPRARRWRPPGPTWAFCSSTSAYAASRRSVFSGWCSRRRVGSPAVSGAGVDPGEVDHAEGSRGATRGFFVARRQTDRVTRVIVGVRPMTVGATSFRPRGRAANHGDHHRRTDPSTGGDFSTCAARGRSAPPSTSLEGHDEDVVVDLTDVPTPST